jgi:toxin secretion/phage lysis holin
MFNSLIDVFQKMIINKSLAFGAVTGVIGTFLDAMLTTKGFNVLHIYIAVALAIIVLLDYVVGVRVAKKNKSYQSNIGIDAVIRDGVIFLIVGVGWIFDQMLGTGAFVFAVLALSFIYHNLQSFVSNLYVLGWDKHFPMWLFKIVESEINAKIKKYDRRAGDK